MLSVAIGCVGAPTLHSITDVALPYVIVQVACLVAIGWRLRTGRHPAGAPSRRTAAPSEDSTPK